MIENTLVQESVNAFASPYESRGMMDEMSWCEPKAFS